MATNTIILIIVTALAALVLAAMVAVVVVMTRRRQRDSRGTTIANENAPQLRREMLADAAADRAKAAIDEIESNLKHQAMSYRSEAVTTRDQLNEQRIHRLTG